MSVNATLDIERFKVEIGRWLSHALDLEHSGLSIIGAPSGGGFSAETVLFAVEDRHDDGSPRQQEFVARVQPVGEGLFATYDLIAEARVIRQLADHTDVPVAQLVGVEPDPDVIGAPFYVMRRTPGRIPADDPPYTASGWVVDLPPEGRAKIFTEFIDVLAQIHSVDWRALDLGFLEPPDGRDVLEHQIAGLEEFYEFASGGVRGNSLIDTGLQWLRENRPTDLGPVVLSWGDCHPHNMIYGDDLTARAALDWEMMSVASPELDVAFLTFAMRLYTEGMGIARPEGFPDTREIVAAYESASGRTLWSLDYYEIFNAVRVSLILMRMGNLMISAGMLPPDATMPFANPATKLLTQMLGAPETAHSTQDWSGHRARERGDQND